MQVRNAENPPKRIRFVLCCLHLPASQPLGCLGEVFQFFGAAVKLWWSVTFLTGSRQAERQNVLRIVPIFIIDNNSCLAGDYYGRLDGLVLILCKKWYKRGGNMSVSQYQCNR